MPETPRPSAPPALDASDEVDLHGLTSALWHGRWLIAAVVVVFLGIGGMIAWLQRPVYQSTAMVRIVPEEQDFNLGASASSMRLLLGMESSSDLQTSIGLLASRRIAEAVVDSLALQVVLRAPQRPRDRVLTVVEAPRVSRRMSLDLRRTPDGPYDLSVNGAKGSVPDQVRIGEVLRVDDLVVRLNPELQHRPPERIRLDLEPYQQTVRQLQQRLAVTQPSSGSQLVQLRYQHSDSLLAAEVPNLTAARFIEYKNHTTRAESDSLLVYLRDQALVYQQDLRTAEARLQRFREHAQIIEPKTQAEEHARYLATVQAERESLETERQSLASLLRQIEARPRSPEDPSPYRQLVAFPSFLTNTMVQNILHSIIEIENERAELLIQRMESNSDVVGRTRRIRELEDELHRVARNYLADREVRIAALGETLQRFAGSVAELPAQEIAFRRLARETELLEQVLQLIELKLKEEEIRSAARLENVQIVDTAVVPDEPEFPKPWLYLALSGILGLFAGSGAAVLRSRANPMVHTREDVYSATAGLPVLAAIDLPRSMPVAGNGRRSLPADAGSRSRSRRGPLRIGAIWPARWPGAPGGTLATAPLISTIHPADRLADSYRSLRTNVTTADTGEGGRVLVLSGADADDDSAVTAANLAIAYAQQGTRTVLIDADLRGGSLHTLFDVARAPGLADVLLRPESVNEVLHQVTVSRAGAPLHLLCSGALEHNPADAVDSPAMRDLVQRLRDGYDHVIIAGPPVNSAPEASLLARLADRALLVVTAGRTTRPALQTAAQQLHHLRIPVEGVVLNGFA